MRFPDSIKMTSENSAFIQFFHINVSGSKGENIRLTVENTLKKGLLGIVSQKTQFPTHLKSKYNFKKTPQTFSENGKPEWLLSCNGQ